LGSCFATVVLSSRHVLVEFPYEIAPAGFIEPCLPSPADKPPSGSNWIHQIKHDGCRLMARRDPVGIRLLTKRGNDWANRFPLVEAVNQPQGEHRMG
jgi:ATP-dependent DNA ligase